MEATAIKELNESVIEKEGYRLLPSAVIYGANSSGKSNFLKAIGKFGEIVNYSSKMSSTDKLNITPFLLNQKSTQEPSFFEIEILIDNQTYTDGFTADNLKVYEEWLYIKEGKAKRPNGRPFVNVSNTAFYCYVIADLTDSMREDAVNAGLILTPDGDGYFGYNQTRGAYIEVISYDKLVRDAIFISLKLTRNTNLKSVNVSSILYTSK